MQIKNARAGLLSNLEVLQLLKDRQAIQNKMLANDRSVEYPEHLQTIQFELTGYLNQTPAETQSREQIKDFLKGFSKFDLTLAEKIQIANLRPRSPVDIYLLIEECEERFNEDEMNEMLTIISQALPRDDDDADMNEENEGTAMDEDEA